MTETTFNYLFDFPDNSKKRFLIKLDAETIKYVSSNNTPPDWALLGVARCTCCQLNLATHDYCPIAANIADLVYAFRGTASHKACQVSCISTARTCSKNTTVQEGLASIMGIIMATSGCPSMSILKPMACFHLPFATVEESMYRSVSAYLLRQYFSHQDGDNCDFFMHRIQEQYGEVQEVNEGLLKRINITSEMDADKNAIVTLNALAQILVMEVDEDLDSLKRLFS
ncbi:hypothetical protein JYT30_01225 [Desulfotalea psychrophila]|nr:hypothetical protein [Desulfocapsa sp.]MBN4058601.1 hypothetical protein [Desulfocapsa sp. AH-315-J15]MBN4071763.1 hypothetical protein [Desulfotalea psychrophila]